MDWFVDLFLRIAGPNPVVQGLVGGLFIAIFAGWLMPRAVTRAELSTRSPAAYAAWRVLVRYVSPVAVIIIVLNLLGLVEVG